MLIRLADRIIRIETMFPYMEEYCADYMIKDRTGGAEPDFGICILPEDIDFEREKSAREDMVEGNPVRHFSDAYLETLAAYRKIAERMPDYDTFLFHGSAISVDGTGYIFIAKSGTGKSTHTKLWRELFGDRAVMVNDDKPLIRIKAVADKNTERGSSQAVVCGTPWDGKHRLSSPVSVPIRAICILERGRQNRIERIGRSEAMPMLIQQSYRPQEPLALAKTLSLLESLAACVGLYRMECNMDIEAAEMAYRVMQEVHC